MKLNLSQGKIRGIMRRRTSKSYSTYVKNFSHLNTFWIPEKLDKYGIPRLHKALIQPDELWPYDERRKSDEYYQDLPKNVALHFFTPDHWFNGVWSYPKRSLDVIHRFDCVITPDFSLYRDWPLAIQLWNTYRNRWLGAWWFSQGFHVIPSVNWSTEASYEFCFEGLPTGGTVAVATMEIHKADSLGQKLFIAGFKEMLRRCHPELILVYGQGFPGKLEDLALIKRYPHRLVQVHQQIKNKK